MTDKIDILTGLCRKFDERQSYIGMKGKKRDDACLEYFIGAATVLHGINHEDAHRIRMFAVLEVSTRGFNAVLRLNSNNL